MQDHFQTVLNDLGAKIGLDLALSAEGQVALGIDDAEIGLTYLAESDEVHLHTIIGALPDTPGATFFGLLMSANHMGAMTMGASIGCDLEAQLVTLNRRVPSGWLNVVRFETLLETFADLAGAWRDNYASLTAAADTEETPDEPAAAGDAWIRM